MRYEEFIGREYFVVWRDFIQCPYRVLKVRVDKVRLDITAKGTFAKFYVVDVEKPLNDFVTGLESLFGSACCAKEFIKQSIQEEFGLSEDVTTRTEKSALSNIYTAIEACGYVLSIPKLLFVQELRKRYETSDSLRVGELFGTYLLRISGHMPIEALGGHINVVKILENLKDADMMQYLSLK